MLILIVCWPSTLLHSHASPCEICLQGHLWSCGGKKEGLRHPLNLIPLYRINLNNAEGVQIFAGQRASTSRGKKDCLEMLILSIKVSEPINITFPNHSSYSSISVPWNTAPQNMRPPRQYWHSPLLTGNFVQLDGQGDLSNILTASLPAEQATSKMKSRWAASSLARLMTGQHWAPSKPLKLGPHGHVTDVFANLSELIHPNDCCSQRDHLKRN